MSDLSMLKYLEKFQKNPKRRTTILQQTLLPWLKQDPAKIQHTVTSSKSNRVSWLNSLRDKRASKRKAMPVDMDICQSQLLPWWRVLIECVPYVHQAEQGFYFDCIVAIMSRYEFIAYDLKPRTFPEDNRYTGLLRKTLQYAIDITSILNPSPGAVIFCAHVLALCFFKVPGLASSLLANLPVKPRIVKRLYREMMDNAEASPTKSNDMYGALPMHLHPLMNAASTPTKKCEFQFSQQWLARWQTSDRAFFILFYQYYHTCLMSYIAAAIPEPQLLSLQERNAILAVSPGYVHLSAYLAAKVITLLQTQYTAPPTAPKEAISAIFALSAQKKTTASNKPRALEAATRRYAYCLTWCATSGHLFHDMLNVWLRSITTSIRWIDSESVFCLLDLIDSMIADLQRKSGNDIPPVDLPFLIHVLQLILERADSAIIHLRTFALIYTHFDFITQRVDLLDMLCNRILLQPYIFERFITHWHSSVRAYYLQCLFWRVSPLWTSEFVCWDPSLPNSCDGERCFRNSWLQGYTASTFDGITDRAKYRQCTLEIHRTLETLLKLFRKHHAFLSRQLENITLNGQERQKTLTQLQSSTASFNEHEPPSTSTSTSTDTHFRSRRLLVSQSVSIAPSSSSNISTTKKPQQEIYVFPSSYRLSFVEDSSDADSGYVSSGNTTPRPSMILDWQYRPTAHIYATKAIEEIQSLTQFARVTPNIPLSLSVDWPSAWTNPLL